MAMQRPSERFGIHQFAEQERMLLDQERGLPGTTRPKRHRGKYVDVPIHAKGGSIAGAVADFTAKREYKTAQRGKNAAMLRGEKPVASTPRYSPSTPVEGIGYDPRDPLQNLSTDLSDIPGMVPQGGKPKAAGGTRGKMVPRKRAEGRYGSVDVLSREGAGGIREFYGAGEGGIPKGRGLNLSGELSPEGLAAAGDFMSAPTPEQITAKGNKALIKKWESMSPRERGRMPKSVADAYGIDQPARPAGAFGIHEGSRPDLGSYSSSGESRIVREARMNNAIMRFPPGRQRREAMQMMAARERNETTRRGQDIQALSNQAGLLQDQQELQGLQAYRAAGLQNDAGRLGLDRERMGLDLLSGQLDRATEIEKAQMTRSNKLEDEQSRQAFEREKVKLQEGLKGRNAMTKGAMDRIDALQEFNPQAATLALQLVPVLAGNSKKYGANNPNLVLGTIQEELAAMRKEGGDIDMKNLKARVLQKFAKQNK